ncbi:hypothetical protein AK812_SmicGene6635 [Symbiodinium microadriaticum]|uniref:Uncharacterized protein n=1 Tax=Symbiodinium microadriaticum TaxID=2951 RepID=A0A1Q9EQS1_SYMMI|nr:hypothetical protein AK812_SmicGene6635 [Symbiodinium microadriaticum]
MLLYQLWGLRIDGLERQKRAVLLVERPPVEELMPNGANSWLTAVMTVKGVKDEGGNGDRDTTATTNTTEEDKDDEVMVQKRRVPLWHCHRAALGAQAAYKEAYA